MKNIYVVIPNWNGQDFIAKCLGSLVRQTQKHTVVVVDNGSVDDSISIVESQFPEVELVKLPQNTGFTGGVNTGIKYALKKGAEAVVLFNNDAVASKDWLKELAIAGDEHPDAGMVTGKFMRMDRKHLDSTGDYYSIWAMPLPRGRNQVDSGQYDAGEYVFSATGGASLYKTTMLKDIGLFDDSFFAYYEDVDMGFRAQLAGWKVWYQPTAVSYHYVSGTSGKLGSFSRYHATKNFFALYYKNMPTWLMIKYGPLFLLQAARLMASSTLKGAGVTYLRGVFKGISNIPYLVKQRRRIQGSRKISTKEVDALLYRHRPPKIPTL